MYEQLSLFDLAPEGIVAECCFDGSTRPAQRPEPWMKRLVPKGEYIVMVGPYPLMLRPVPARAEDIEAGHRYYHYTIDGRVYSGIFLGRDTAKGG